VQTTRLAASFELLNSFLPLSGPEIHAHKSTCDPVVLVLTAWFRSDAKVHHYQIEILQSR